MLMTILILLAPVPIFPILGIQNKLVKKLTLRGWGHGPRDRELV
jgi:hypothetical protein